MPFSSLPASNLFRIPQLQGVPPEIHFDDAFGTPSKGNLSNPLTGSLFFLAPSDSPQPAPKYDYDETGVVLEGTLVLRDENGKTVVLERGDTFFINRGSTILFTTPKYAVAFKAAARLKSPSKL